jgi:hypothetical protein
MDAIIILPLPPAGDNKDKIHFRVLHDAQIFAAQNAYIFLQLDCDFAFTAKAKIRSSKWHIC